MPPKPPKGFIDAASKAAKEAGKGISQELSTYGDEQQTQQPAKPIRRFKLPSSQRDELAEMMSQNRQLLEDSRSSLSRGHQFSDDLQEQTSFRDLVRSSREQMPLSFAKEGEVIQTGIASKLYFDESVSGQKQDELTNAFYEVIANRDTPALVRDVFLASSREIGLESIHFSSAKVESENATEGGQYIIPLKTMEINDSNNLSGKDAMTLFAHESTHVMQSAMRRKESTREAVSGEYLVKAFKKDCTKDFKENGLRGKAVGIARSMAQYSDKASYYPEEEVSDEIHAMVMEELLNNPEEAKKTFKNTLEQIGEIHKQYNLSVGQEVINSMGFGGRT